jgi:hypothetical protein
MADVEKPHNVEVNSSDVSSPAHPQLTTTADGDPKVTAKAWTVVAVS